MTDYTLYSKINLLPDELKEEVGLYINALLEKKAEQGIATKPERKAGFLKGTFIINEGFDEPLEDFKEYM